MSHCTTVFVQTSRTVLKLRALGNVRGSDIGADRIECHVTW